MDKKRRDNYCITTRYSIIEITPSFLKNKIPIIQIFNYSLYWLLSIYFFVRNLFISLLSGVSNFIGYITSFFKKKITSKNKGSDIAFDVYKIDKKNLKNPFENKIDDISLLPNNIIFKKEVYFFYKQDATKKINELKNKFHIKINDDVDLNNIVVKKEIFYISKHSSKLCNKITISISYNQAAILSFKILKKMKIL